ncbi:MAG: hypothetical protein H7836_04580 [Magnetococcus sp. YQC-3]
MNFDSEFYKKYTFISNGYGSKHIKVKLSRFDNLNKMEETLLKVNKWVDYKVNLENERFYKFLKEQKVRRFNDGEYIYYLKNRSYRDRDNTWFPSDIDNEWIDTERIDDKDLPKEILGEFREDLSEIYRNKEKRIYKLWGIRSKFFKVFERIIEEKLNILSSNTSYDNRFTYKLLTINNRIYIVNRNEIIFPDDYSSFSAEQLNAAKRV